MSKPTKPPSEKRLAANRDNAARSTGPRTPEGKARSALNSRKHVFNPASFAVVRLEELDSVAKLRADAIATYRPVNSQELFAVERIALAQQSLIRCGNLEAGFHTDFMNETIARDGFPPNLLSEELTDDIQVTRAQNRNLCLAVGFQRSVRKSEAWKLFVRYQAQTERLYRRAVEEFERLKKLRAELPNEANNEPINEPINETEIEPIAPEDLMPPPPPPGKSEADLDFIARFDEINARTKEEAKNNPKPWEFPDLNLKPKGG
jgi:hypothetical protein